MLIQVYFSNATNQRTDLNFRFYILLILRKKMAIVLNYLQL